MSAMSQIPTESSEVLAELSGTRERDAEPSGTRERDAEPSGTRERAAEPSGTRERIQHVALELFTEQGYEATSLREIAERLGVTKAALYYHFKTKDDIVSSLVERQVANLADLLTWAGGQPRNADTRREFVRRYAEMLRQGGHDRLIRFFERNPTVMQSLKSGSHMRERMVAILDILSDRSDPLPEQLRCSLAIFALHATWFVVRDPEVTEEQRRAASLEVALDLVTGPR